MKAYNDAYVDVNDKFEIVFISSDDDEHDFDNYYKLMPWKALTFSGKSIIPAKQIDIRFVIEMDTVNIHMDLFVISIQLFHFHIRQYFAQASDCAMQETVERKRIIIQIYDGLFEFSIH